MTKREYSAYVSSLSHKSPLGRDVACAFLIGGGICTVGQLIMMGFEALKLSETQCATATSIAMVFLGALLTALSLYDDLAKVGGAGTLVPITGFSNAVSAPAMEFRSEGLVTGTAVKIFAIAGPVLVFGIGASFLYGVGLWLWWLIF